jgi:hypothetical protein
MPPPRPLVDVELLQMDELVAHDLDHLLGRVGAGVPKIRM